MRRIKYIILFAAFALAHLSAYCQMNEPGKIKRCPVKTIGIEQGLLNERTNSIVTDSLGFTWVSTRIGLQRYNGYILENINPVVKKDTVFINAPVFLFGLKNGAFWLSYKNGILEYNPATNSFKKIVTTHASPSSFFPIVPLMQTPDGIWCMQENKGIVIYQNADFHLKKNDSSIVSEINTLISSEDILARRAIVNNGNNIFIRLNASRLLQINTRTFQFNYLDDFDSDIIGLGCAADNLIVSTRKNLCSYSVTSHTLKKKIAIRNFYSDSLNLSCVQPAENNTLLISFNGELFEFDTALTHYREIMTLSKDPIERGSFKRQIYIDEMKRVWLLTNNDIEVVRNVEVPFDHFIYPAEKSNSVRSVYYDEQKHLLLAACINIDTGKNGGVRLFDTLANPLWKKPLGALEAGSISAIEKLDNDHYLVIAFDRHGWYLMDLTKRKFSPFVMMVDEQTKSDLYSNQWTNNVQRINDSTLYIACSANIFRCVLRNDCLIKATRLLPFNANSSNSITCFIYTADSVLWAGTNSGLIYRFKNKQLENVQINGGYTIRCFSQDSLKNIWVGTDKGAYIFSETGSLIKSIDKESGLLNDFIYAILPVGKTNSVFASSNMGLSFISLNGTIKNYTKEFGLQSNEFNTESAIKTGTGKLYFGGVNGINAFYPGALSETIDTPILNVTRLSVNDSLYKFSSGSWTGDTLLLKYPENHIELDLAALGLFNADEYTYTYRLSNFEQSWQTTHQPTGIKYTLSPGKYLLEVRCSIIFYPENVLYKKIMIILQPPWWQTLWFRAIAMIAMTSVIFLLVWQYNRRKFDRKVRALQLQHEIQHERERISRDLHDNLGAYAAAIAANVVKVKKDDRSEEAVQELQSNSQAIVNQLNDTIWALNREEISLTSISDRFKVFLQKIRPSYQQISIHVQEFITEDMSLSPVNALHLFRIMQEAVNNAARHSNCSSITVSVKSDANWVITIADNGEGIMYDASMAAGNGLRNMKMRAADAGWDIKWENEKPKGTKVIIVAGQAHIL
ncbi:MAG TPA: ATP-binding protein [Puia sp.]|nr:ATP-binding protein [Puia sp.]